jgi:1-phosphatidylinositol-4-phosphate 5-kinase
VLVGNLIGEDHVNYVLMYNMLTGIRVGVSLRPCRLSEACADFLSQVSRCQAKIKRTLTDDDFTARHKFSFDMYVTPPSLSSL